VKVINTLGVICTATTVVPTDLIRKVSKNQLVTSGHIKVFGRTIPMSVWRHFFISTDLEVLFINK